MAGAKRRRREGGRKARKSEKTLSTQSPSFFPSSLSPTPFDVCYARRLTGFRYAIQFEAHDNGGVACLGGGGGGLLLGIFGGAQTKKVFFYTRFQTFYKDRNYVIITYIRKPTRRLLKIHFQFAYCSSYVINLELKRHYVDALL